MNGKIIASLEQAIGSLVSALPMLESAFRALAAIREAREGNGILGQNGVETALEEALQAIARTAEWGRERKADLSAPPAPVVAPARKATPRKRQAKASAPKADAAPTAPPAADQPAAPKAKRTTTRKAKAAPAPKDCASPSTSTPPIATAPKDSVTASSKPADTAPVAALPVASVACQDAPVSKPDGRSIEELAAILRGCSAIDVVAALGKAGMLAAVLKAAIRPSKVA
jgi:hypothetical protein